MPETPTKSIEAFIHKVIDYAGLFPPAKLSLKDTFDNYVKYLNGEYSRMLSNLIVPAKMLGELTSLIKESDNSDFLHLSILGSGGDTVQAFNNSLDKELAEWRKFIDENSGKIETEFYEVKLPAEFVESQDSDRIGEFIDHTSGSIKKIIDKDIFMFFEGTPGEDWRIDISSIVEGIKMHNLNDNNAGYKMRTGGVEASAFPLPEQVAFSIKECLNRQFPMKCTAGLHHPLRHYNNEVNSRMHGFLNVIGAGAIAIRHNISEYEMIKILEEDDITAFEFTDEYFSWDKYKVTVDDIKYSREALIISYGSCSFDEPVEDLQKLNLL